MRRQRARAAPAQRRHAHGRGGRHAHAWQRAGHRVLRPRGLPHRPRVPDDGSRQGRGAPGRHRLLRTPPHRSRPGHRHGDRHADRRGDGPAAGEGQGHPVGCQTRAPVQHVHRRVEHHQLPVLPRAVSGGGGEERAGGGGRRTPRLRDGPGHGQGGQHHRPERQERVLRGAGHQGCRLADEARGGRTQGGIRLHPRREAHQAGRRPGGRDRPQAVHPGPSGPRRQTLHGLPAAHDQRQGRQGQQPRGGQGDARHHRRRPDRQRHRGTGRDVRPVHRRGQRPPGGLGPGAQGRRVGRHGRGRG